MRGYLEFEWLSCRWLEGKRRAWGELIDALGRQQEKQEPGKPGVARRN